MEDIDEYDLHLNIENISSKKKEEKRFENVFGRNRQAPKHFSYQQYFRLRIKIFAYRARV